MPRGDKSKYTDKQKRQAEHIEEGYETRGVSRKEAERRAWATVNSESGGGNKSGSGRANSGSSAPGKGAGPARRAAMRSHAPVTKAAVGRKQQTLSRRGSSPH